MRCGKPQPARWVGSANDAPAGRGDEGASFIDKLMHCYQSPKCDFQPAQVGISNPSLNLSELADLGSLPNSPLPRAEWPLALLFACRLSMP